MRELFRLIAIERDPAVLENIVIPHIDNDAAAAVSARDKAPPFMREGDVGSRVRGAFVPFGPVILRIDVRCIIEFRSP